MTTIPDAKFTALRGKGHTGAMPDMELQWLLSLGATTPQLSDAWIEMLAIKLGVSQTGLQQNDAWTQLLSNLGYDGSISDQERAFWEAGGVIP